MAHHSLPRLPAPGWGPLDPEDAARWRRVLQRLDAARCRCQHPAEALPEPRAPHGPVLSLHQALLLAHDLFMLGHLNSAPTLRWRVSDAETALSPWHVHVVEEVRPLDGTEAPPSEHP